MAVTCILMVKVQIFSLHFITFLKGDQHQRERYRFYKEFPTTTISRVGDMLKGILAGASTTILRQLQLGCDPDSGPLSDDMNIINKLDNLCINDLKFSKGIRIAYLNINSPRYSKIFDERRVVMQNPIEILAVNGTKIDSFLVDEISVAGYHLIRKTVIDMEEVCCCMYGAQYTVLSVMTCEFTGKNMFGN